MATRELRVTLVGDPTALQAAFAKAGASASALERRFGTAGAAANRVGTQMATLAKRAALPAAAIGALSVKSFVDFDRAMTKSTAIMDDVSEKMRSDMVDAARVVGKETQFSATQAAESYFFLASAGLDAQQSLKSMPIVAKFATAGNFDLATATDLVTDAQSALGLTVDKTQKNMRNMTHVSDVLTKANTLANATIQQFSEALTNKGAASLRILGKDLEEGTAVLAAYADQGLKGAAAGTAMSIVLRDLQKSALANGEAFKEAGIRVFDASGEMRNIGDIVGELEDRFEGMSDKQKKAELSTLGFQEKSQQFLLTLIGTSDSIEEYEKGLRDASGTTDRVAKKSMEGFAGSMERLKSQVADAGLEIGERLAPTLQELAEIVGDDQLAASEKFEESLDLIVQKLSDLAPKAAGVGAKVGAKFAEGIAKSFVESDLLGKLFIGAAALRLFGGKGVFLALGRAMGRNMGRGMALGLLLFGPDLVKEAEQLGERIGEAIRKPVRTAFETLVNFGIDAINEVIKAFNKLPIAPDIDLIGGVDFKDWIEDAKDAARQLRDGAVSFDEAVEGIQKATGKSKGQAAKALDRALHRADKAAERTADTSEKTNKRVGKSYERMRRQAEKELGLLPPAAAKNVASIWLPFRSLFDATGGGLETLVGNVRSALDIFGITKLAKYAAKKVSGALAGRQQGGPLKIGGSGTGDTVPMLAPEGSFVLNRNAAAALGFQRGGVVPFVGEPGEVVFPPEMASAASIANELFPRFQQGGFPELQPAARALANQLAGKGFIPTSTFRPTSTTHHGRGEAIDYGDSVNNLRQLWSLLRPKAGSFAELFGPSYLPAPTLFKAGVPFSSPGLQATHEDHIHLAVTSAISKLGAAMGQGLARIRLDGPAGPLRSLGQAALDRTHRAGSSFLDKQLAASSDAHAGMGATAGGQFGKSKLINLWTRAGGSPAKANLAAAISLAESGGNPKARNVNTNGTIDRGLWQINSIHGKLSTFNPAGNARSAVQLSGGGKNFSPWVAYNTGAHQKFLQSGGLVGMQKGGRVGLGKLGSGSLLDLISLQISLAESTEGTADDIEALTDRFDLLGKGAKRTRKQLAELTKGPLLGKRDRERIAKEARERSKDADLSPSERKEIREEAKRRVGRRDFGGKKGKGLRDARREAKEELQQRLEREAERAKEAEREGKLRKRLTKKARREERRDRRQERADLISDSTSQIEDMRSTREEIADKTREAVEEQLEQEMQDRLEAFDRATEAALENIPQAAELESLRAQDERIADEADRSELVRELERIKKSGSARLIAEHEAELAAFDRAQRIEQLEKELADEQERIEEERAAARIALEDQLEARRQEAIAQQVADATAAIDTQIERMVEGLERVVDSVTGGRGRGRNRRPNRRAHGGPVAPNEPFLVGEEGAELFVPTAAGRVESHRDTERALGGDTNITIHAHGSVADDPFKLANHIAFQLQSRTRLAGVA